jgi:hypothetical protein
MTALPAGRAVTARPGNRSVARGYLRHKLNLWGAVEVPKNGYATEQRSTKSMHRLLELATVVALLIQLQSVLMIGLP